METPTQPPDKLEGAIGWVILAHYAGRPDWVTTDVIRKCLRTGEAVGREQGALREIFQTVDIWTGEDPEEIREIVEEEGLDPGRTRALLKSCYVTNDKILDWLEAEAARRSRGDAAGSRTKPQQAPARQPQERRA